MRQIVRIATLVTLAGGSFPLAWSQDTAPPAASPEGLPALAERGPARAPSLVVHGPRSATPTLAVRGGPDGGRAWLVAPELPGAPARPGFPAGRILARLDLGPDGGGELPLGDALAGEALELVAVVLDRHGLPVGPPSAPLTVGVPPVGPRVRDHQVGGVIVTEFLKDPTAVGDSQGEWIELWNTTNTTIDVEGWVLSDHGSDSTVLDNGGLGILVPPRGHKVLCRGVDPAFNGGVFGAAEYFGMTLSNGADEIVLSRPNGHVADEVVYDDGPLWPDPSGASVQLLPGRSAARWNDDPTNWTEGSVPYGNGDLGTPGWVNVP